MSTGMFTKQGFILCRHLLQGEMGSGVCTGSGTELRKGSTSKPSYPLSQAGRVTGSHKPTGPLMHDRLQNALNSIRNHGTCSELGFNHDQPQGFLRGRMDEHVQLFDHAGGALCPVTVKLKPPGQSCPFHRPP